MFFIPSASDKAEFLARFLKADPRRGFALEAYRVSPGSDAD